MESFYDPALGSVASHIDNAAFALINLPLPGWYINPEIKAVFSEREAWDAVVDPAPLSVAPGMEDVLSHKTPPSVDFFKTLPSPSLTIKQWGGYAILLELNGQYLLYIGIGTNTSDRIRGRERGYKNMTGTIPDLVQKALDEGYTMVSWGMLWWTDMPPPDRVPRLRARFKVIEAVFTIIFCACVKTIMDDVFIPDFFLWQRADVTWGPACTHLSLMEGIGADMKLTEEELIAAAAARQERLRQKTARYRKRKRDEDEDAFLQRGLAQFYAWSAANPGRVNEIAAGVRQRAKDNARFRCEVCDHNAATQFALDEHDKTRAHLEAVQNGGKVVSPPTTGALAIQGRRAEIIKNRTHYCKLCDKPCTSQSDLDRHNATQKHKKAVAAEEQAAAASSST